MALTREEAWFKQADQDRDGAVGGHEAVSFFLKSGLSQEVLGQVRQLQQRANRNAQALICLVSQAPILWRGRRTRNTDLGVRSQRWRQPQ
jgi:hypothetical protein